MDQATALQQSPAADSPLGHCISAYQMASAPLMGSCSCGKVKFEATEPVFHGYCHCHSCQLYHCAPFIAAVVLKSGDFRISEGSQNLFKVNLTPKVDRYSCNSCRSPIYNDPLGFPMVSTFPMLLKAFDMQPQVHAWFSHAVIPASCLKDGLPRHPERPPRLSS